MTSSFHHLPFGSADRVSQSLSNDRCQNIIYKSVFEHFIDIKRIAVLLLASKAFQNSSFGANFLVNFVIDANTIRLLESVLSPSSCFSLQFVPSLHVKQSWTHADKINVSISTFILEFLSSKYLHLSLRSLTLAGASKAVISSFFGSCSNQWPKLREFSLENCGLNDSVLEIISKNSAQLRTAKFSGCSGITDNGLGHIADLSAISSLKLRFCFDITDAGLEFVSKLSRITSLDLSYSGSITDVGLEHISKLFEITELNLTSCNKISDEGLRHVSNLSVLTSLDLSGCIKITDSGLEHVSKLSCITSLNVSMCVKITNTGLEHLTKICGITSLTLSFCDSITDDCLEQIVKMPKITSLSLVGCKKVTPGGTARLKNELPKCKMTLL